MNTNAYPLVSGIVFLVVALAHGVRAVLGLQLLVGTTNIPISLSWLAAVVAAALAVWGFNAHLHRR